MQNLFTGQKLQRNVTNKDDIPNIPLTQEIVVMQTCTSIPWSSGSIRDSVEMYEGRVAVESQHPMTG